MKQNLSMYICIYFLDAYDFISIDLVNVLNNKLQKKITNKNIEIIKKG